MTRQYVLCDICSEFKMSKTARVKVSVVLVSLSCVFAHYVHCSLLAYAYNFFSPFQVSVGNSSALRTDTYIPRKCEF